MLKIASFLRTALLTRKSTATVMAKSEIPRRMLLMFGYSAYAVRGTPTTVMATIPISAFFRDGRKNSDE